MWKAFSAQSSVHKRLCSDAEISPDGVLLCTGGKCEPSTCNYAVRLAFSRFLQQYANELFLRLQQFTLKGYGCPKSHCSFTEPKTGFSYDLHALSLPGNGCYKKTGAAADYLFNVRTLMC